MVVMVAVETPRRMPTRSWESIAVRWCPSGATIARVLGSVPAPGRRATLHLRPRRLQPEPLVAAAQQRDERDREQYHPGLADDLAGQEFERAEGEPEEHHRIDDEPDEARRGDRGNEPPPRARRGDRKIGEL